MNDIVKEKAVAGIYPNPVSDILYIRGTEKIEKAAIYNMVGQIVKTFTSVHNQIDVSSLSKGNYILQYSLKEGIMESYKFIKK